MPMEDLDTTEKLIRDLKHGNIHGSYEVAKTTVDVLLNVISKEKWSNTEELIDLIRKHGKQLMASQPSENTIDNMVCRVLKIIKDESRHDSDKSEEDSGETLQKLLLAKGDVEVYNRSFSILKPAIVDAINEFLVELETSRDNIASQALDHIHSNEVIMTAGKSDTVEAFLRKAAKKRNFKVIVVECAPFYHGQQLATRLAAVGINTTVITDSAVFAMMARVNKVIIGTHTVMANGGLKAVNGSHAIALAAKYHSVPLVVCAPMYKLSPQYLCSYDQDAFNKFGSPGDVLDFSEGEILSRSQIYNPIFDYVPPELVTLFIFNIGGNAPSYVYRLLSEMYDMADASLITN